MKKIVGCFALLFALACTPTQHVAGDTGGFGGASGNAGSSGGTKTTCLTPECLDDVAVVTTSGVTTTDSATVVVVTVAPPTGSVLVSEKTGFGGRSGSSGSAGKSQ